MFMSSSRLLVAALVLSLASAMTQAVVVIDTATQGNWVGVYGSQGYILNAFNNPADETSLPGYVASYSYTGAATHTWQAPVPPGPNFAQSVEDPTETFRRAATRFSGGSFTVTLNLAVPQHFYLSIYGLDFDSTTRVETIQVGPGPATADNSVSLSSFNLGKWATFDVNALAGPLNIVVTRTGGANAVISAIAFDPIVPEPATAAMGVVGLAALAMRRRRAA